MKKTFFLKITSFALGAFLTLSSISTTVFAVKNDPFYSEDSLRQKIIASASGKRNSAIYRNHHVMGNTGRYIVSFNEDVSLSKIHWAISSYNYRLLADSSERVFLIYLQDKNDFAKKNESIIKHIEEDKEKTLTAYIPNDTYASSYELEMINMPDAWEYGFGNQEITIAILDSGVDRYHEDLKDANILPGMNYETGESFVNSDSDGHGTKVTGIIAATPNNSAGSCGIAPDCTILPIKITNAGGRIYTSDFIDSLYLAADSGADIINMSLGGYDPLESEEAAVKYAYEKGCILVAAAGNEGNDEEFAGMKSYPASFDGVISVGAVNQLGESCVFSQHNDKVDISAPGDRLQLLQSGGGYTTDSGTSFAAPFISGIAALSLSLLDKGIEMTGDQFDYLLSFCAQGKRSERMGYGIADAKKALDFTNFPLVSGVKNGGIYYDNVTITYNRGTAVLDDEEFKSGDLCKHSGEHVLSVTDGDKVTMVNFSTDNLPLTYTIKEGQGYSWLNIPFGEATLDGIPYKSGDKITTDGKHTLVIKGIYGNEKTHTFNLSFARPHIQGVKDGETYDHPVRISIATTGKIFLDGKEQKNEFTVYENGHHTVVIKQNGNLTTSVNFNINYDYATFETATTDAKCAYGSGIIAVWNSLNEGVRLYDSESFKLLKYLYTGENIKDVHFTDEILYIASQNTLFSAEISKIKDTSILSKVFKFEFPISAADFNENNLYFCQSSSINSGTVKKMDLSTLEQSDICFIRKNPDIISYDEKTDSVAFGTKDETEIYVSPSHGGTVSRFSPFESQSGGFIFKNGKISCNGQVFSVEASKMIFSTSNKKTLYFDGVTLVTEKCVYNTETFELLGVHAMELTGAEYSDGKYFCSFGKVSLYVSSAPPSAASFEVKIASVLRDDFREHVSLNKNFTSTLVLNGYIYASCDENTVYILNANTLEYQSHFNVPFVPSGMETAGKYVFVYSEKMNDIYMYDPAKNKLSYISAPRGVKDLSVSEKHVAFIGDGQLYICDKATGEILLKDENKDYISLSLSKDGKNLYAIRSKSFYTSLTCFSVEEMKKQHEQILNYEPSDIFCDNIYLYINTAVYYAQTGEIAYSASSKIYGRTGDTFLTANGLFKDGTYISHMDQSGNAFATSSDGTLYVFDKNEIYITRCIYGNNYNIESSVIGIENGKEYSSAVTVEFSKGKGYLDGTSIESKSEITDGGKHKFLLVLPYGLVYEYNFSINASLESLRIAGGDAAIKVNDTVKFSVVFLPQGSPAEEVMFYSEGDVINVTQDGTVTGLKQGTAKLYAATMDGRIVTHITVNVLSSMISFNNSFYETDRTNNILYGISSGTTVNALHAALDSDIRDNTKILDGENLAEGILKTGMSIVLYSKNGEIQDKLTISVSGDCNGDGDIDIGDLVTALDLMNKTDAAPLLVKSADFSNNGIVDVADTFTFKEIILGHEKNIPVANIEKPQFDGKITFECKENEDGTFTLVLSASEKQIKGISGKIKFDKENLVFVSSEKTGLLLDTWEEEGYIHFVSIFNTATDGEIIKLNFLPKVDKKFDFSAEDIYVFSTETEKCSAISASYEKSKKAVLSMLTPSEGTLYPEFSPDIYHYIIKVKEGVESIKFDTSSDAVIVGADDIKDGSVISVFYGDAEYKITVMTEKSSPEEENNTILVLSIVISSLLILGALVFFLLKTRQKTTKINT